MKKTSKIIISVIAIILVFATGFYTGTHYDFTFTHWSTSLLSRTLAEANMNCILLNKLTDNKPNDVIKMLNLSLDGNIVAIDQLLKNKTDPAILKNANRILASIGEYRKKYPFYDNDADIRSKVDKFLNEKI
jgi:hypothetical protein